MNSQKMEKALRLLATYCPEGGLDYAETGRYTFPVYREFVMKTALEALEEPGENTICNVCGVPAHMHRAKEA